MLHVLDVHSNSNLLKVQLLSSNHLQAKCLINHSNFCEFMDLKQKETKCQKDWFYGNGCVFVETSFSVSIVVVNIKQFTTFCPFLLLSLEKLKV